MSIKGGVAGTLEFGGQVWAIDAETEPTYSVDAWEKEGIPGGQGGNAGTTSKPVAPYIEAVLLKDESQAFGELRAADDEGPHTCTLELKDGTVVTINDAEIIGAITPGTKKNSATVRFEGRTGREVR